jgi:hypothetical protein
MSEDDNQASKNYNRRIAQELAELDTPRARAQAVLDRFWQNKLDDEFEDNDWVEISGYWERKSAMPSFHRSKRDRDF